MDRIASASSLSSPAGNSGIALGAAQNRRRHSARPDSARLADRLPRRQRTDEPEQRHTPALLLGWSDGAFEGASTNHPLSFGRAGVDATLPQECHGTVANVVFPTGIDRRGDLGIPDRFDIYYGMADNRIGVARLDVPDILPPGELADAPEATV